MGNDFTLGPNDTSYTSKHERLNQHKERDYLEVTTEMNHYDWPIKNSSFVVIDPHRGNSTLTVVTGPKYASS